MGFGTRFRAATRGQLRALSTAPSGASPEAIWQQFYDTQNYVSATTVRLQFFQVTNVSANITNMTAGGQFPDPQWLSIYDITCDFLSQPTFAGTAQLAGQLNDIFLLLLIGNPFWTLSISDKRYGPYSLTNLHGTGGGVGDVASGGTTSFQYGTNALNPGWNYKGTLIIPPKTNFTIEVVWAAAQTLNLDPTPIRLSLFGILSRRVL